MIELKVHIVEPEPKPKTWRDWVKAAFLTLIALFLVISSWY